MLDIPNTMIPLIMGIEKITQNNHAPLPTMRSAEPDLFQSSSLDLGRAEQLHKKRLWLLLKHEKLEELGRLNGPRSPVGSFSRVFEVSNGP